MPLVIATLAVIPILVGPKLEVGLSSINEQIGSAAAWRPAIAVLDAEELFVRDPNHETARLENCGADLNCLARALEPLSLSYALLLVVNSEVSPPLVALRALDLKQRKIVAEEVGSVDPQKLAETMRMRAQRLFDALGFVEAGKITVRREPDDAVIDLSPAPLAAIAGDRFWVAPGGYRVTARSSDQSVSADVAAVAGEEREVRLRVPESTSIVESPWLWAGVGAGVAAIAIAIIAASVDSGTDVCLGAPRSMCE